ncbi:MAG: hypothetical protein DMG07_18815, partial [Acidobacteria bacterium]
MKHRLFCSIRVATLLALAAAVYPRDHDEQGRKGSDVPMTRPQECLAVVDGVGSEATFAELPDGSIMVARGRGRFSTSKDGGATWSEPREARDVNGELLDGSDHNLIRLPGNGVGYASRGSGKGGEEVSHLRFWRSEDGGRSWQRPVRIGAPSSYGVAALNDVIFRTSSGRIVLPVYGYFGDSGYGRLGLGGMLGGLRKGQFISTGAHMYDPRFCWSFVYYSDDDGRTWKMSRTREIFIWLAEPMMWHMTGEPTAVEVQPGKLLMFVRNDLGRLFQSWSYDNGETWTAPQPTQLAASNAPAQLRRIPGTGDLLVVWTQIGEEELRKGFLRARLSSAVSRTNGGIWEFFQNVESSLEGARVEPGPIRMVRPEGLVQRRLDQPAPERDPQYVIDLPDNYCRCSYPGVFFYKDRVLVTHTNAHYDKDDNYV